MAYEHLPRPHLTPTLPLCPQSYLGWSTFKGLPKEIRVIRDSQFWLPIPVEYMNRKVQLPGPGAFGTSYAKRVEPSSHTEIRGGANVTC